MFDVFAFPVGWNAANGRMEIGKCSAYDAVRKMRHKANVWNDVRGRAGCECASKLYLSVRVSSLCTCQRAGRWKNAQIYVYAAHENCFVIAAPDASENDTSPLNAKLFHVPSSIGIIRIKVPREKSTGVT